MSRTFTRVAYSLALVIGGLAILAGTPVLLGRDPGYYVIDWLPIYNLIMGVLTLVIAVPLIWRQHRAALPVALAIFASHAIVMLLLQTAYREVVATASIVAMSLRLLVWALILGLMLWQIRGKPARKGLPIP